MNKYWKEAIFWFCIGWSASSLCIMWLLQFEGITASSILTVGIVGWLIAVGLRLNEIRLFWKWKREYIENEQH